ncbi:MAG: aminopeptidase P family protein [Alphaproteobacteria bacterium]|jgi:Xaa-Pro aminopeptidase
MTDSYDNDALIAALENAGVGISPDAVRGLIDGVAGAPSGRAPDAWVDLIAPNASAAARAQLAAFATNIQGDGGLGESPAPRERIADLRVELSRRGLDGFITPRTDEYQGEYVPPHADRLRWLTGFSGSAGVAVILADKAAIFIDGRYTIQVQSEVHADIIEPRHVSDAPPAAWVTENLSAGMKLGFDPWLHTKRSADGFRAAAEKAGAELIAVTDNPVDAVWADQPAAPISPIIPHAPEYAGEPAAEKRAALGAALQEEGLDAAVLTAPDSIAWLLNIRGGDVPHTPLPLSFAILHKTGSVDWFVDTRKLAPGLGAHLGNGVAIAEQDSFPDALAALGGKSVRVDPGVASAAVFAHLDSGGAILDNGADPCALPKACKNAVELNGARNAHERDGVALTKFLAWTEKTAAAGGLREMQAADQLQSYRYESDLARDLSFRTISGSGANGAIVHYSVSEKTDRVLQDGELFLVDSGAQYLDGTTDVTRTIAIGAPSAEMKDRFTRVLKGHIAIATARFPEGTSGSQLDPMARRALWDVGLDFDHGTGHGVGSYLGVHEGPHRISKMPSSVALQPGMIVSNEPGYYKMGAYGIRIENLVTVVPCKLEGAERTMLEFETLTLAPIDRNLVDPAIMTTAELEWLNAYHARMRTVLSPVLDGDISAWLAQATAPILEE